MAESPHGVTVDIRSVGYYPGIRNNNAVVTNLEGDIQQILHINRGRWEIEENFRIMKYEFDARPVYVHREDRIRAHFLTCFLSLLVYRLLEKKMGENEKFINIALSAQMQKRLESLVSIGSSRFFIS